MHFVPLGIVNKTKVLGVCQSRRNNQLFRLSVFRVAVQVEQRSQKLRISQRKFVSGGRPKRHGSSRNRSIKLRVRLFGDDVLQLNLFNHILNAWYAETENAPWTYGEADAWQPRRLSGSQNA